MMRTVEGKYFDTFNTISACCEENLLQAAMDRCAWYDSLLSKTVEGSDVWKINHAGGEPVLVNPDTLTILRTAAEVSAASGGAFNIAVGAIVNLWRFTSGGSEIPSETHLKAAVSRSDPAKIKLDGGQV